MAKMRKIPENTSRFRFNNPNPKSQRAADCVVRAISIASDQSWDTVYDKLCLVGKGYKCMPNEKKAYEFYLKTLGFVKMNQLRRGDNTKYRINELLDAMNAGDSKILNGKDADIIFHAGTHHICAVVKDDVYGYRVNDIWDSSYETAGVYFIRFK